MTFLSDVLDDLNHEQLTNLLNWLVIQGYVPTRANVRQWRKDNEVDPESLPTNDVNHQCNVLDCDCDYDANV